MCNIILPTFHDAQLNFTRPLANANTAFELSAYKTTNDYTTFNSHVEILRGITGNYRVCRFDALFQGLQVILPLVTIKTPE